MPILRSLGYFFGLITLLPSGVFRKQIQVIDQNGKPLKDAVVSLVVKKATTEMPPTRKEMLYL